MAQIRPPRRAKLFCGLLASDEDLLAEARRRLGTQFGTPETASDIWPFANTDYYADEMGDSIVRQFVTFGELFSIERLPEIKRLTNTLEWRFCDDLALPHTTRPVNLDPGYLTLSKVVLATTKDYSHRLYIGGGMYAEVTLHYESGEWTPWPWTYPDYRSANYLAFFQQVREIYRQQLAGDDG
jgi:hypothetical protein